ncbi:MAG: hypothetical protein FWD48_03375 [Oscillospiraceae bacterium]|nr:hypothetical protein [Oscillospiraceae bacterium]
MEERIITAFDNLDITQTERLIGENMEIKIKNKDRRRIESAVLEKMGAKKERRAYAPRKLVAVALAAMLLTLTITAGAVNEWDFNRVLPAIVQNLFGNNEKILDNMHSEIKNNVVSNTFEGLELEITSLYADEYSITMTVDVVAEAPILGQGVPRVNLINNACNRSVVEDNIGMGTYQVHSEDRYKITIVANFNLNDEISTGDSFTFTVGNFVIPRFNHDDEVVYTLEGDAEIKFTVDLLAKGNNINAYPDITLKNGNILTRVVLNPFEIRLFIDGREDYIHRNTAPDGFGYGYIKEDVLSIVAKNGMVTDYTALQAYGPVIPRTGASYWYAEDENVTYLSFGSSFDNDILFDIDDIAGIIFRGIEIPLY